MDNVKKIIDNMTVNDNSVIVFDIDGTLINNDGTPKTEVIDIYIHSVKKGLKPVIITAREGNENNIEYTIKQLEQFGINYYIQMYFRPPNKDNQPIFKLHSRKNLHDAGYDVKMSIGDMWWDIGEYGGVGIIV